MAVISGLIPPWRPMRNCQLILWEIALALILFLGARSLPSGYEGLSKRQASRQSGLTRGDWSHRALKGPYKVLKGPHKRPYKASEGLIRTLKGLIRHLRAL